MILFAGFAGTRVGIVRVTFDTAGLSLYWWGCRKLMNNRVAFSLKKAKTALIKGYRQLGNRTANTRGWQVGTGPAKLWWLVQTLLKLHAPSQNFLSPPVKPSP